MIPVCPRPHAEGSTGQSRLIQNKNMKSKQDNTLIATAAKAGDKGLEKAVRAAQAAASGESERPWDYSSVVELQAGIDSGTVWRLEGSIGRAANAALECGACFLPLTRSSDYYGSTIPARSDLKPGTKGTLGNSVKFYDL